MKRWLVVAVLLTGCTTAPTAATQSVPQSDKLKWPLRPESWARDGATPADFERERGECFRDSGGLNVPLDDGSVMYRYWPATYKKCMEDRGWKDVHVK